MGTIRCTDCNTAVQCARCPGRCFEVPDNVGSAQSSLLYGPARFKPAAISKDDHTPKHVAPIPLDEFKAMMAKAEADFNYIKENATQLQQAADQASEDKQAAISALQTASEALDEARTQLNTSSETAEASLKGMKQWWALWQLVLSAVGILLGAVSVAAASLQLEDNNDKAKQPVTTEAVSGKARASASCALASSSGVVVASLIVLTINWITFCKEFYAPPLNAAAHLAFTSAQTRFKSAVESLALQRRSP